MTARESRRRLAWSDLPGEVRALVTDREGEIVDVVSHEGGYSPGMAATLSTVGGVRVFVKAVSAAVHEVSDTLYRREVAVNAVMPAGVPSPRMRWATTGEWVVMCFDAADSSITTPWHHDDLHDALVALAAVGRCEAPIQLPRLATSLAQMTGWQDALDGGIDLSSWEPWVGHHLGDLVAMSRGWWDAADGGALCHADARADNMVRAGDRLLVVDWPHAAAGAPWSDVVGMLPSVGLEGGGDPEQVWRSTGLDETADADAVTTFIAGLAGYFVCSSMLASPVGVPHVRAYQHAQGEVALAWLRQRIGAG